MYETKYHKPSSLDAAAGALASADDAKFLGGGQTLIPTMKQRLAAPSDLIDVTGLAELKGISFDGTTLTIGAATTHAEVAASADVKTAIPSLASLAGGIGDPQVRHMGTLGGSVANNDPAADYPSAVLGLSATVNTNKRSVPADDFFDGMFATSLDEDEIIVSISFPKPKRSAYAKFDNPASRYALVGAFVAELADGSVRVAVTGAGSDGVYREGAMESALSANFAADALSGTSADPDAMMSDIHGSAAYRAHLVKVMAGRAVAAAG
ncbi:MAG: xanthine dehydrogenase family protein subunit M [Pseudomonadota bacterium]